MSASVNQQYFIHLSVWPTLQCKTSASSAG